MISNETKPRNLSVTQTCEWLGLARSTFYLLLKNGKAPVGIRLGRKRLFPITQLEAWMTSLESQKAGG